MAAPTDITRKSRVDVCRAAHAAQLVVSVVFIAAMWVLAPNAAAENYVSITFEDEIGDRPDPPGDLAMMRFHFLEAQGTSIRMDFQAAPGMFFSGDPLVNGGDVWLGSQFVTEDNPEQLRGVGSPRITLPGPLSRIVNDGQFFSDSFADLRIGDRVREFSQVNRYIDGALGVCSALGSGICDKPDGFLSSVAVVSTHPMKDFSNVWSDQDSQGILVDGDTVFRLRSSSGYALTTVSGPGVSGIAVEYNPTPFFTADEAALMITTSEASAASVEDRTGLVASVGFPSTSYTAETRAGVLAIFFYRPRDLTAARLEISLAEMTGSTPLEARLVLTDESGNRNATPEFPLPGSPQDFFFRTNDFSVPVSGSGFDQTKVSNFELEVFSATPGLDPVPATIVQVDNPSIELREPKVRLGASADIVRPGEQVELTWDSADADDCYASGGWSGVRPLSGTATVIANGRDFEMTCTGPNSETLPNTDRVSLKFPKWSVSFDDPADDHSGLVDVLKVTLDVTEEGPYKATVLANPAAPFVVGNTNVNLRFTNGDVTPFTTDDALLRVGGFGKTVETPTQITIEGYCIIEAFCSALVNSQIGDRMSASNRPFGPFEDVNFDEVSVVTVNGVAGFDRFEEYIVQIEIVDTDGDGVPDTDDALPLDPNESADNDGDGIGDNADTDDDNDGMPDQWEIDNGLDPLDASDAGIDSDGDFLTNRQEFLAGTDPNLADTDLDTFDDGFDNCPVDSNVDQHDTDGDEIGDACEIYFDTTGFADVSGDGVPDVVAFVSDAGGQPQAVVFSGADGSIVRTLNFLNPGWTNVAADTIDDGNGDGVANDPAIAMLLVAPATGKLLVQVRDASTGANINKINFLNPDWAPSDIVVINDPNGDGSPNDAAIGVMAVNKTTGRILIQVRRLSNGAKIGSLSFMNTDYKPVAAASVPRAGQTALLGVLGFDTGTARILVQTRQLSDAALVNNRKYLDPNWAARDLAAVADGDSDGTADDPAWLVLAKSYASQGANLVQARYAENGSFIKNITYLTPDYRAQRLATSADISGNGREEASVFAVRTSTGQRIMQVRDFDDGSRTLNIFP